MKKLELPETIYDKTIKKFLVEFGCSKIKALPRLTDFLHEGQKTVNELSYKIQIFFDIPGAMYISVTCSKPIKNVFYAEVLKIINSSNIDEQIAKYTIGVDDNQVSCTTFHFVLEEQDTYSTLDAHVDCSIGNVESIYDMFND
jgi:hypothetical protein